MDKTAIIETLAGHYAGRINLVVRRKAAEHTRLAALDLFGMDEKKAQWTLRRIAELEEELILLNDFLHMADAFREAWDEQSNARAETTFWWTRREYEHMARLAHDYQDRYRHLLDHLITTTQLFITAGPQKMPAKQAA